jgi:hypothetical protein
MHGAFDLLEIIEKRRAAKVAIEYLGALDDDDEKKRANNGMGHNWLRLRHMRLEEKGDYRYATMLFEFVDQGVWSFPVVHTTNFTGREIAGEEDERGATAAHVVMRMPIKAYDDGTYRCAIESMPSIARKDVDGFLSRQIRRYADSVELAFEVDLPPKGKRKNVSQNLTGTIRGSRW